MTKDEILKFYDCNEGLYDDFKVVLEFVTKQLLKKDSLNYVTLSSRLKNRNKFLEKAKAKKYDDLMRQFTDFVGLRIIARNNEDVEKISNLIEKSFEIDWPNSSKKKDELGLDKVGYLSNHYIVSFSSAQLKSAEKKDFAGLKAEIQVRTLLQHAWAELTHDDIYNVQHYEKDKLKSKAATDVIREINTLAGTLEHIDNLMIDLHKKLVAIDNSNSDDELNEKNLSKLIRENFPSITSNAEFVKLDDILDELKKFGLKNIYEFKTLIPTDLPNYIEKFNGKINYSWIARAIMAIKNINKFCKVTNVTKFGPEMRETLENFNVVYKNACKKYSITVK